MLIYSQTEIDVIDDVDAYQTWPGWLMLISRIGIMVRFGLKTVKTVLLFDILTYWITGVVSVLFESNYGFRTSKEQIRFLPAFRCSFAGLVHLFADRRFGRSSSSSSMEDQIATRNRLFSQFSRLRSHGSFTMAYTV